jgi:hypothetical protein
MTEWKYLDLNMKLKTICDKLVACQKVKYEEGMDWLL